ncbi:uncharacterized protein LOC119098876 [Pollicipes pollicipes]|uniref:uncharacterized protein LOC119098876 n=1 Tax=Pollicipes pollicipes TaxID=41117 RepID=UPI001884A54A|nr:uncharacterized protein LOC119098876 [Pollicipes pollicipes]
MADSSDDAEPPTVVGADDEALDGMGPTPADPAVDDRPAQADAGASASDASEQEGAPSEQEFDEAQLDSADSEDGDSKKPLPACKLKRNYYCKVCSFSTTNPREFLYHQKEVHRAKLQINKCPHCIYASRCKVKLNRHVRMVHEDKSFKQEESPEKSLTIACSPPLKEDEDDEEGIEEEEIEEESMLSLKELEDRGAEILREEDIEEEMTTALSHKSSRSRSDLKKKFYRCSKCQYMTHIKSRFTKHVKYHSMPMIKCELCEFRTPYKWNLDRHMKNHSGSGEFQCNQCNFTAHIKQSLTVHIQNHHLPASQVLEKLRAKCNVGGSDVMDPTDPSAEVVEVDEEEMLRLEREEDMDEDDVEQEDVKATKEASRPRVKLTARKTMPSARASAENSERHDFDNDFVHPDDVVERNGKIYIKDLKCSVCSYKTLYEKDLLRHEYSQHGVVRNGVIPPVFSAPKPAPPVATIVSAQARAPAALLVAAPVAVEKPKPKRPPPSLIPIPSLASQPDGEGSEPDADADAAERADAESVDGDSPEAVAMNERAERAAEEFLSAKPTEAGPRSVLDRLFCKKMAAAGADAPKSDETKPASGAPPGGKQLSRGTSTRCQYCRHRCKTTDDLRTHQKTCPEATKDKAATAADEPDAERKVFVWNSGTADAEQVGEEKTVLEKELKVVGEVVADEDGGASPEANGSPKTRSHGPANDSDANAKMVTRRVFKCPSCTFWATTASRFHVHLVGHMNMKPYECSECGYRSNWRWDITKHIKLKSAKDRSHLRAKLFINDGGSTRDYDKYDVYLEYMEVEEGLQCKPQVSSAPRKRSYSVSPASQSAAGLPRPPRPPLPVRPGLPVPPNVTITSRYGGLPQPVYEPPLIAFRHVGFKQPLLDLRYPVRGMLLQGVRLPGVPLKPAAPAPSLESLKRMDPALAAMGITDENTAIVMPEPPPDATAAAAAAADPTGKKATVWRCKKCNFKHKDRRMMLAHVAKHTNREKYNCGHCGKPSNWQSVIRRHCRMKHNGDVSVVENKLETEDQPPQKAASQKPGSDVTISVVNKQGDSATGGVSFRCDICSYTCANTDETISAHMQHHTPQPGATFKCMFCPYYVGTKKALCDHMILHGVTSPQHFLAQKTRESAGAVQVAPPPAEPFEPVELVQVGPAEPQSANKPFRCTHCPFSTDSKSQFLHHRQFHMPRGMPYRCPACSYGVAQRSHLIQHARLHGLQPRAGGTGTGTGAGTGTGTGTATGAGTVTGAGTGAGDRPRRSLLKPERSTVSGPVLRDSETRLLDEVPLVWVSRGGKFFKMFKCRQCPHVNLRKSNIQDHERMHTDRDLAGYAHRCTKCNYVCINAGVLSGHLKVHTYWLGKIHAVVDMKKTDEEQLREILGEDSVSDVEVLVDKTLALPAPSPAAPAPAAAVTEGGGDPERILYFCQHCPARFFHDNEIKIHSRFHGMNLPFTCQKCSYTARQHPHLLAHLKVHSDEYRERTRSLLVIYTSSPDHPPRGTAPAAPGTAAAPAVPAPVPSPPDKRPTPSPSPSPAARPVPSVPPAPTSKPAWKVKRFACSKCPARFVKDATLKYHLSLHGSAGPFRCDKCNYAVKTYGNLVQHLNLHSESDVAGNGSSHRSSPEADLARLRAPAADDFPMSGVDLLKRKLDFEKEHMGALNESNMPSRKVMRFAPPSMDPSSPYYAERAGNPDFAYPTVLDRYGREREKRYKCRRCPSAFEKREQYVKHTSLHSVQNKYTCTICDYSVKYYPNFCNHMKRHGIRPPPAEEAASALVSGLESGSVSPSGAAGGGGDSPRAAGAGRAVYTGPPELTTVEKQQLVLQRVREEQDALKEDSEPPRRVHWCELCPYANIRRDTTENHRWRHQFYGSRGGFSCKYCDYAAHQSHLLREHHKIHFRPCKYIRVDSFTELVKLEVFMKEVSVEDDKEALEETFEDVDVSTHDVLFTACDWDEDEERDEPAGAEPPVLVNVKTGEFVSDRRDGEAAASDAEDVEAELAGGARGEGAEPGAEAAGGGGGGGGETEIEQHTNAEKHRDPVVKAEDEDNAGERAGEEDAFGADREDSLDGGGEAPTLPVKAEDDEGERHGEEPDEEMAEEDEEIAAEDEEMPEDEDEDAAGAD